MPSIKALAISIDVQLGARGQPKLSMPVRKIYRLIVDCDVLQAQLDSGNRLCKIRFQMGWFVGVSQDPGSPAQINRVKSIVHRSAAQSAWAIAPLLKTHLPGRMAVPR